MHTTFYHEWSAYIQYLSSLLLHLYWINERPIYTYLPKKDLYYLKRHRTQNRIRENKRLNIKLKSQLCSSGKELVEMLLAYNVHSAAIVRDSADPKVPIHAAGF